MFVCVSLVNGRSISRRFEPQVFLFSAPRTWQNSYLWQPGGFRPVCLEIWVPRAYTLRLAQVAAFIRRSYGV